MYKVWNCNFKMIPIHRDFYVLLYIYIKIFLFYTELASQNVSVKVIPIIVMIQATRYDTPPIQIMHMINVSGYSAWRRRQSGTVIQSTRLMGHVRSHRSLRALDVFSLGHGHMVLLLESV